MKTVSTIAEQSEVLILPDGKILAHNITPEMAAVLSELDPTNELMQRRAARIVAASRESAPTLRKLQCAFTPAANLEK